ncbi:MAG: glycosyltransferase, partial [Halobacteria archaeon]
MKNGVFVVEVSFEVANKVGGIYTVLASKASQMMKHFPNYLAIGFYNPSTSPQDFTSKTPSIEMENVLRELSNEGIIAHYGIWIGGSNAPCILLETHRYMNAIVDQNDFYRRISDSTLPGASVNRIASHVIKRRNWELFKIDSYHTPLSYDEPISWSEAVGHLLELLVKSPLFKDKEMVVFAHEWLSAGVIFRKKAKNLSYRTIFVTHATVSGRVESSLGIDIVTKMSNGLAKGEQFQVQSAYERGIAALHLTEVAAANNADLFATVSKLAAKEAEYYLGKAPDIILTNGFDITKYKSFSEIRRTHYVNREKILGFIEAFFSPYYEVETTNCTILTTSGRYEFRNKGFDLLIETLAKLNQELNKSRNANPIYAFFLVPSNVKGINSEVLDAIMYYHDVKAMLEPIAEYFQKRLANAIVQRKYTLLNKTLNELIGERIALQSFLEKATATTPVSIEKNCAPLSTHDYLYSPDPIIDHCWNLGLRNEKDDVVKVIVIPSYLSKNKPPLFLDYFDFLNGCDIGIFPSKYEPFGLTPVEAAANGCLAVTTDLAGFGIELINMGKA